MKTMMLFLLACLVLSSGCGLRTPTEKNTSSTRPNILLIMADDMGFSDIGCYGGEIRTPNIDGLARDGIRLTRFYNNAWCSPTRASLLTGLYPHQVGMAGLADQDTGSAGPAQGYLNHRCVTLAEVLGSAGYLTLMSGKWHLGEYEPFWPIHRGFQHYFGLISGAANYFDIRKTKSAKTVRFMAVDSMAYRPPDSGFYMTDAITDHAVQMLQQQAGSQDPFFLYVAYTAPHWPLHALPEDIARYAGTYKAGWDSLRAERYRRQQAMGLLSPGTTLSPRDTAVQAWESLSAAEQDSMAAKMAVYAAQIDRMDQGIGRVLRALHALGKEDNTIVIFLSDNGGCAEGGPQGFDKRGNGLPPGGVDSYMSYGQSWAGASNTPFPYYKKFVNEGGVSTPFILRWPARLKADRRGQIMEQVGHVTDMMPTICAAAGATYPRAYKGQAILPQEGQNLLPALLTGKATDHAPIYWALRGQRALLSGKYKLLSTGPTDAWQLFDLQGDRAETKDLAAANPELVRRLSARWAAWASRTGVDKP